MMNVLSIQSHVAFGHVGNAAAVFPLQRLGFEVWPVNTVQFSNHTGYGDWTGDIFSADHIADLVRGIDERGQLPTCDAVLSGYMGDAALGAAILDTVAQVRAANPKALYVCDPVMGDVGRGIFVRPGIPEFMRQHAVPAADIIAPNQFELELLTGKTVVSLESAVAAARSALELGPQVVLLTSLRHDGLADDRIAMLAVNGEGAWWTSTPLLAFEQGPNGSGDATAALFLAHYLLQADVRHALEQAAAAIFAIMETTHRAGTRELQLVAAQDDIVKPPRRFPVEAV